MEEQLIKDRRERSGHLNARISISLVCASSSGIRAKVSHGDTICNIVYGVEHQHVELEHIDGGGRHW